MESVAKQPQSQKYKKREVKISTVYSRSLITRNIMLPINAIGKNLSEIIEQSIRTNFEGKCVVEGYIKPDSIILITHSSGLISGIQISFEVVFECQICCPVEGMLVNCSAKEITKAGIRAESSNETPSPVVVFIAKDHHYSNQHFATIQEGDKFTARVIGQRFELNDKYVSIIAELVIPKPDQPFSRTGKKEKKARLIIEG